ncbi:universal stress protein [Luteibacter yeojuensis]|uniref:Universal stress protein n=1 Tax=Luteibacter yeojuensis TaxID=345309 RepID=A0A7X5QSH3_9GAMM|nr:universal stress protein [Luteibacter yeojuensis]NID14608.1 universal stress protein [Luteibacter yeojuensis]
MQTSTKVPTASANDGTSRPAGAPVDAFTGVLSLLGQDPHDAVVLEAAAHLVPGTTRWRALLPVPLPEHVPCPWGESPLSALATDHLARRTDAEAHLESLRRSMARLHTHVECERAECPERQLAASVLRHARGAGLVVAGVPTDGGPAQPMAASWFVPLLIRGGRPVVVVPRGASLARRPRQVLVAWSDTAEAARALHEALRWLPKDCRLRVVTATDAREARVVSESMLGASSLIAHLERHERTASFEVLDRRGVPVEDALLGEARDMSADLVVMGAYGHSRAAEYVFGGVTRALLHRSRVPLLLAH